MNLSSLAQEMMKGTLHRIGTEINAIPIALYQFFDMLFLSHSIIHVLIHVFGLTLGFFQLIFSVTVLFDVHLCASSA